MKSTTEVAAGIWAFFTLRVRAPASACFSATAVSVTSDPLRPQVMLASVRLINGRF